MHICLMSEVPKKYYKMNSTKFKENVYLTSRDEVYNIIKFIDRFGVEEYKNIFNILEIKYDDIDSNGLTYKVNNQTLALCDLSSGERMLLYGYIMNKLEETLILIGLTKRMNLKHRNILYNTLGNSKYLVVFVFNRSDVIDEPESKFYKSFEEMQKEGVL